MNPKNPLLGYATAKNDSKSRRGAWAVGKWLFGESLPNHDKLLVLARWLRVSPEWLLFGVGEAETANSAEQSASTYSETDLSLCREIATLNGEHRKIVREMMALLARMEREPG